MQSESVIYVENDFNESLNELNEAIRKDPSDVYAYIELAWLLATCPNAKIRNGRRAVSLALHALELDRDHPHLPETLAAAYAEAGHFELAVHWRTLSLDSLLVDER